MISSVIRAPTIEKNHLEFWGDLLDETNEKETIREIPNTNKKNAEDDDEGHKGTTERDELNISYWLYQEGVTGPWQNPPGLSREFRPSGSL